MEHQQKSSTSSDLSCRRLGYARSATGEGMDLQRKSLLAAGYGEIFEDVRASGLDSERSGLATLLGTMQRGDEVVVGDIARLSRRMDLTAELLKRFEEHGVRISAMDRENRPSLVVR